MDNAALSKLVTRMIKDVTEWKTATCRTGYVGTGARKNRRQLFVRLPSGWCVDLWFEERSVGLGGVINSGVARVEHLDGESMGSVAVRVIEELGRISHGKTGR